MNVIASRLERLRPWWQAREPRERRMLAAMGLCVAAFALWYGLLAPLLAARARAESDYLAASRTLAEVRGALDDIAAVRAQRPAPPSPDQYRDIIARSAGAAGLSIDRHGTDADGGIEAGLDAARAEALFSWLDTLRLDHGIAPVAVRIERRNGFVHATLRFPPP